MSASAPRASSGCRPTQRPAQKGNARSLSSEIREAIRGARPLRIVARRVTKPGGNAALPASGELSNTTSMAPEGARTPETGRPYEHLRHERCAELRLCTSAANGRGRIPRSWPPAPRESPSGLAAEGSVDSVAGDLVHGARRVGVDGGTPPWLVSGDAIGLTVWSDLRLSKLGRRLILAGS